MYIVKALTICINIAVIISLLIGLFYSFKLPKHKAIFGYTVAGCMIFYLAVLCLILIYGLIVKPDFYCFILFLCLISPFIIGKLVKYETVKKYTIIQIICFMVSFAALLIKF